MEALFSSTLAVAIAEIGDKTQLLSLFLAARFAHRYAIILGILVATLINHAVSAWLGVWAMQFVPDGWEHWLIGGSFILVGLWVLIPDKDEGASGSLDRYGAFVATTVLFFLAEIGDKTQVATVVLAAQYQSLLLVTLGTTLGMLIANVPVVLAGNWIMQRLPMHLMRWTACAVFILLGILSIALV
ncbi:TMEM165/GDT1 family protein [Hahella ganghwensis]|uniref:TMEM165/GDT1 family protein n=1 Tax=Hahella ganghwensis TaxID=286420 RepID=UPI00038228EA|nr:TMEM165/GDT1 family protein [Hahella ganghwensis]